MSSPLYNILKLSLLLALVTALSACGINNIPTFDEKVKSNWSQVENQYQRRADLIPNLVATVKGYAAQEKETLTAVVEARAKVGSMQVGKDLVNDPQALANFEKAQ
ncbi:MAG: LemA protein, partial [Paraglaciecola psychrophila]